MKDRFESTKRAGLFGILANIFLLIIKGFIGLICNSQAMIADAVNSASDIFASLMTFIGNKIASEPQDDSHNLGHGKAEYIFSLFISISMIIVSIKLLYNSILSLITGSYINFSFILVIVCIITIIVKILLFIYTNILSKRFNNILLESNKKDHKNDCIVTMFTLISVILSLFNIYWFDGIVGIGISLWICYTGIKIFIESYNILMDKSIDIETKDIILDLIKCYSNVKNIDNFSSLPVGYQYFISFTIFVDGNMSTFDSHNLADTIENEINKLDKVYKTIIHVNPI